jgi:hypothetical protein
LRARRRSRADLLGRSALASTGIVSKRPLRHCRTRRRGVREPDVHMERRQPTGCRLTRPANLLKVRRHLVKAQARVIAASRADNLIPARVAISITVDHADRLCPEKSGATIMPGDSMTDRHAAIVHREPNVPDKETDELQVANWLHNTERLQTRPKHARKVHSAIKDPIGICIHVVRADRPSGTSCLLMLERGVGERPSPDRCWRRRGQRHRLTSPGWSASGTDSAGTPSDLHYPPALGDRPTRSAPVAEVEQNEPDCGTLSAR